MNKLVITDCIDCNDNCPKTSYGTGLICKYESIDKEVTQLGEMFPIPDWCPKLTAQKNLYIITETIPVNEEMDKEINIHFGRRQSKTTKL